MNVEEERGTVNIFTDVDGTVKFNILLPLVLTENVLSDRFPIFLRSETYSVRTYLKANCHLNVLLIKKEIHISLTNTVMNQWNR